MNGVKNFCQMKVTGSEVFHLAVDGAIQRGQKIFLGAEMMGPHFSQVCDYTGGYHLFITEKYSLPGPVFP